MNTKTAPTVLVVDHDPSTLCLVEELLSANEYQPILASSGEEALDIVAKHSSIIDLLLTDIDMPGINGIVLAKYFCSFYPKIKVLFMSGCILPSTLYSILGKKVAFLQKPFHIKKLIDQIKFVLG